jgi:hypothetical protein
VVPRPAADRVLSISDEKLGESADCRYQSGVDIETLPPKYELRDSGLVALWAASESTSPEVQRSSVSEPVAWPPQHWWMIGPEALRRRARFELHELRFSFEDSAAERVDQEV